MSKKTILFVDDEPFVLSGLRRMCYPLCNNWNFIFAGSGASAIEVLEKNDISILISDMRMPVINGLELFNIVECRFPGIIRIILTGQTDKGMYLAAMLTSHYFLCKPANFQCLSYLLNNILNLGSYLKDNGMIKFIHEIKYLPSRKNSMIMLSDILKNEEIKDVEISTVINDDVSMAAQVLKFVNSAHFNVSRRIKTIDAAVSCLGNDVIRQLIASQNLSSQFSEDEYARFGVDLIWRRSRNSARVSRLLVKLYSSEVEDVEDAYLSGLLHEIGKLILIRYAPDVYENVLLMGRSREKSESDVERELFGTDHAAVGAYLVSLWGLPCAIADAISTHCHDDLSSEDVEKLPPVSRAVWLASRMNCEDGLSGRGSELV